MSLDFQLGELTGRVQTLEAQLVDERARRDRELAELRTDVKKILEAMNQARGSWKFLLGIASFSSTMGAALTWLLTHFGGRP